VQLRSAEFPVLQALLASAWEPGTSHLESFLEGAAPCHHPEAVLSEDRKEEAKAVQEEPSE